jgi:FAD:protein FMN transferase
VIDRHEVHHQVEARTRAMGSHAHVVVVGDRAESILALALTRIADLERRWSRFVPSSEVSTLNSRRGVPTIVSADTRLLVERALLAAELTDGRFDPTMVDTIEALGYDRDFSRVRGERSLLRPTHGSGLGVAGAAGIRVESTLDAITLPVDVGFDPGGIGKGLAADLVVTELMEAGAAGAMVNLGGDLRVEGTAPTPDGWVIGIEEPCDSARNVATVTVRRGAVCTSSRFRRRWTSADGHDLHHLIDPMSGMPVQHPIATITVVAGEAWWAEALTKALFVAGVLDRGQAERLLVNASALVILTDGTVEHYGKAGVFHVEG